MSEHLNMIANTIRGLSMDAIDAANSGHPGLPLGCAEIAAVLFTRVLRYNPKNPDWVNRDRFVLSAGHGSMLLYSALHLSGYAITLEDIKKFRQYHACTAGHPEFREVPGVETTTGPLGQGIATGIGMALAQKMAGARLDAPHLFDGKVFILAGDGCLMEGISSEASSLAGHLNLNNVVLIYDSNDICLDGDIKECFTENVEQRYRAYGWNVVTIDGHNVEQIEKTLSNRTQDKPLLVIAKTKIGKGSPSYEGKSDAHGKAFGAEETAATKKKIGLPETLFFVPDDVKTFFDAVKQKGQAQEAEWNASVSTWAAAHPDKKALFDALSSKTLTESSLDAIKHLDIKPGLATRQSSGQILQVLHDELPFVVGGSADLSSSDNTFMKKSGIVGPGQFSPRNIKYGVREFAMGAMASGIALQGLFVPFCGTFLTFSDYMKNAIRLAALMKLQVVYQFTHDSIFLGEDGPTHQPVEHLAALRSMPDVTVIRPADEKEVKGAWLFALTHQAPTALILSRQGLPSLENTSVDGVRKGGYIVRKEKSNAVDFCILATGSELHLAVQTADELEQNHGKSVRVVSLVSFENFDKQDKAYRESVLGQATRYVSIEAQTSFGWHKYIGKDGVAISVDTFGLSAPAKDLARHFGFTVPQILEKLL